MPYFTKTQQLKTRLICSNTAWIHFMLLPAILINKGILLHYQHSTKLSFFWAWNAMVYHPWVARNISCMTLCMFFFWVWSCDHMLYHPWEVRDKPWSFLVCLFFCSDLLIIWCTALERSATHLVPFLHYFISAVTLGSYGVPPLSGLGHAVHDIFLLE